MKTTADATSNAVKNAAGNAKEAAADAAGTAQQKATDYAQVAMEYGQKALDAGRKALGPIGARVGNALGGECMFHFSACAAAMCRAPVLTPYAAYL
jgi:hypothetical protein